MKRFLSMFLCLCFAVGWQTQTAVALDESRMETNCRSVKLGRKVKQKIECPADISAGDSLDAQSPQSFDLGKDRLPEFEGGGVDEFRNWIKRSVIFPTKMIREGVYGRVVVSFIVQRDGSLSNIEVLENPAQELTDVVLDALAHAPHWSPGMLCDKQTGAMKPVRVKYTLPIDFKIPRRMRTPDAPVRDQGRAEIRGQK